MLLCVQAASQAVLGPVRAPSHCPSLQHLETRPGTKMLCEHPFWRDTPHSLGVLLASGTGRFCAYLGVCWREEGRRQEAGRERLGAEPAELSGCRSGLGSDITGLRVSCPGRLDRAPGGLGDPHQVPARLPQFPPFQSSGSETGLWCPSWSVTPSWVTLSQ